MKALNALKSNGIEKDEAYPYGTYPDPYTATVSIHECIYFSLN